MNLIEKLKPLILEEGGEDLNLYALSEVGNWPEIDDGDGGTEPLDLENVEVIKLDAEEAVIWGGGDWQEPRKITIRLVDGEPSVVSHEDGGSYSDHKFLDEDDITEILGSP